MELDTLDLKESALQGIVALITILNGMDHLDHLPELKARFPSQIRKQQKPTPNQGMATLENQTKV